MNDVNNGAREFVGDGRDEAINKACAFFGVDDESALEISGYEAGAIYGLATRSVIVAIPKGAKPAPARSRDDAGRGGDAKRGSSGPASFSSVLSRAFSSSSMAPAGFRRSR